jgi:hypothetical protein
MVTAEAAIVLPTVIAAGLVSLAVLLAGVDQVRCADAARVAVRLAARGEPDATVRAAAIRSAPAGAQLGIGSDGVSVTVTVLVRRSVLGIGQELSGSATAALEAALSDLAP